MASLIPNLTALAGEVIDRKRRAGSTYPNGREVKGTETIVTDIPASIQPPFGAFLRRIAATPEGKRSKVWIVIFCALDTLLGVDDKNNTSPDVVTYEGDDYEVQNVTHRKGLRLNHDVALAVMLR